MCYSCRVFELNKSDRGLPFSPNNANIPKKKHKMARSVAGAKRSPPALPPVLDALEGDETGSSSDDDDDAPGLCEDLGFRCPLGERNASEMVCGACKRTSRYVSEAGCDCPGCPNETICAYCHSHPNVRYSSSPPGGGDTNDSMCEDCCARCDPGMRDYWHPIPDYGGMPPLEVPPATATHVPEPSGTKRKHPDRGDDDDGDSSDQPRRVSRKKPADDEVLLAAHDDILADLIREGVDAQTADTVLSEAFQYVQGSQQQQEPHTPKAVNEAQLAPTVIRRTVDDADGEDRRSGTSAALVGGTGGGSGGGLRPKEKFMPPLALWDAPLEMSVQNLVFTGVLGASVRLPHVASALARHGAELNQKRFSAVIMRIHMNVRETDYEDVMLQQLQPVELVRPRLMKIAVLIFRNGNLVCTGAKTFAAARYMLLRTAENLRAIGYADARIVRMNVRNMVGRAQLPCRIDRERMARELSAFVNYDPEQFPGAVVRHPMTRPITLLVFDSGRVVVTGTKCKARADAALARIKPLLVHFDVNTPPGTPLPIISWSEETRDRSLYDLLGVEPDSNMKEIRASFRVRARQLHPDKNLHLKPGTAAYNRNLSLYKRTDTAYQILNDPELRDRYDRTGEGRDEGGADAAPAGGSGDDDDGDDGAAAAAAADAAVDMSDVDAEADMEEDVSDVDLAMALEEMLHMSDDDEMG